MLRASVIGAACLVAAGILAGPASPAAAQEVPTKPVRIIVPFPAGGAVDVTARMIAQKLADEWRQSVVVENRPGATGNVGAEQVARAVPDGTTLLMSSPGVFTTNRLLFKAMPYDPDTDLTPVSIAVITPNVLVRHPDFDAADLRALLARARANPGKIQYASQGIGSTAHLTGALMAQVAGLDLVHVPYRGDAPAMNDVVAGHVPLMWNTLGSVRPHVLAGRVKALAVGSTERVPTLAEVPTAQEAGLPGFESATWFAMAAPAATPEALVAGISQGVARALRAADVQARLNEIGVRGVGNSPAEMKAFVAAETAKWTAVVRKAGIAPQ